MLAEQRNVLSAGDVRTQERVFKCVSWYFRTFHNLQVDLHESYPMEGAALGLMAHFTYFDGALFAADSRNPKTIPVVKQELMRIPLVGRWLKLWEAIPVARDGSDTGPLRRIKQALKEERSVCIAAEGTRSKTGHLGSLNRTLVRLAIQASENGIPVFPIAAEGADLVLPKGTFLPRFVPITVITGPNIDLSPWHRQRLSSEDLVEPARLIRKKIALLLPERNRPLPGTAALAVLTTSPEPTEPAASPKHRL